MTTPVWLPSDTHARGELRKALEPMMRAEFDRQDAMEADKPNVVDSHSDGKRVRYVRSLERAAVLAEILSMLEDAS